MVKRLILCDCMKSQTVDAKQISEHCDVECSRLYTNLCGSQIADAAKEIQSGDAIVACLQEQAVFEELAEEIDAPVPGFIDLRDRAGWSDDPKNSGPKMAALINDALLPLPPVKMLDIQSHGRCLILGANEMALDAAEQLAEMLSVTVLLSDTDDLPINRRFDVVSGRLKNVNGSLGEFNVAIDALRQLIPGGRSGFGLGEPRDGGRTDCDIILDLTGGTSMFPPLTLGTDICAPTHGTRKRSAKRSWLPRNWWAGSRSRFMSRMITICAPIRGPKLSAVPPASTIAVLPR